jgi:hypothetical protein
MRASTFAAALVLALASPAVVQAQDPAPAVTQAPAADPADVASPEAIIDAVYEVISGDAGVARDWDRFRSLFHPTARLVPSGFNPDGDMVVRVWTPEEYVTRAGPLLERDGFHEREIASRTERFGSMAHVFSTYDSRRSADDAEPFARGINSFQLVYDGTRWWILSIYWTGETETSPIPAEYLP